jgi:hypothetical protein
VDAGVVFIASTMLDAEGNQASVDIVMSSNRAQVIFTFSLITNMPDGVTLGMNNTMII